MRFRPRLAASLAFALFLVGPAALAGSPQLRQDRPLRVMSQNLYVGADVFRIAQAQTPEQVPFVAAEVWAIVQQTNFPERARRIAEQVDHDKPDILGLQEVSTLTRLAPGDPPDLQVIDFLAELLAALEARGLDYVLAGVVDNADVELPIATETGLGLARLQDRDVVLVRSHVAVSEVEPRTYETNLVIPLGNPPYAFIEFRRGWVSMGVELFGRSFRYVNTHLEVRGAEIDPLVPFIQAAQAQELIAALAPETRPVILTGDLNSSPVDPVVPPLYPPYAQLTASGFTDLWTERLGAPEIGWTCCQTETLDNAEPALTERIDFVFVRGPLGPVKVETIGEEPADWTPSALWPSDHAGVSSRFHLADPVGPKKKRSR